MDANTIIQLIGYLGSFLVVVSMLMTSLVKLRLINIIGSVIFTVYALIIKSYPTAAMQVCLITINAIGIFRLSKSKKDFSIVQANSGESYISYFESLYKEDIKKFFPDCENIFEKNSSAADNKSGRKFFITCCNSNTAGLCIAKQKSEDALEIELDYSTPSYRDCSVGKHLYQYLKAQGIKEVSASTSIPAHSKYLRTLGFKEHDGVFVKQL